MSEISPADMELIDMAQKVHEMAVWLEEAFMADCAEGEYTEGCASCDAGIAIKHLRLIEAGLNPFISKAKPSQGDEK